MVAARPHTDPAAQLPRQGQGHAVLRNYQLWTSLSRLSLVHAIIDSRRPPQFPAEPTKCTPHPILLPRAAANQTTFCQPRKLRFSCICATLQVCPHQQLKILIRHSRPSGSQRTLGDGSILDSTRGHSTAILLPHTRSTRDCPEGHRHATALYIQTVRILLVNVVRQHTAHSTPSHLALSHCTKGPVHTLSALIKYLSTFLGTPQLTFKYSVPCPFPAKPHRSLERRPVRILVAAAFTCCHCCCAATAFHQTSKRKYQNIFPCLPTHVSSCSTLNKPQGPRLSCPPGEPRSPSQPYSTIHCPRPVESIRRLFRPRLW